MVGPQISKRPETRRGGRSNWRGWKECVNRDSVDWQESFSSPFTLRLFKQLLSTLKKTKLVSQLFCATGLHCVKTRRESPFQPSPQNVSFTSSSSLPCVCVFQKSETLHRWWGVREILWQTESAAKVTLVTASADGDCPKEAQFPGDRCLIVFYGREGETLAFISFWSRHAPNLESQI